MGWSRRCGPGVLYDLGTCPGPYADLAALSECHQCGDRAKGMMRTAG